MIWRLHKEICCLRSKHLPTHRIASNVLNYSLYHDGGCKNWHVGDLLTQLIRPDAPSSVSLRMLTAEYILLPTDADSMAKRTPRLRAEVHHSR